MKRIQASGIGSRPKQVEIISEEEEELLWQKGLLGDSSPQVLLDTMVYCCGLFFALRSGGEHKSLRHSLCHIQVVQRHGERAYLEYTEDLTKNRPGGLRGRKVKQNIMPIPHTQSVALCAFSSAIESFSQLTLHHTCFTSSLSVHQLRRAGSASDYSVTTLLERQWHVFAPRLGYRATRPIIV